MSNVWYGNVTNRIAENRNYTGREIQVGDDITMYMWSDRKCYYVTEVIDQKHIKVKPYFVCADKDADNGMGHQNWVYFKDYEEYCAYCGIDYSDTGAWGIYYAGLYDEQTWAYRYGQWMADVTDCAEIGDDNWLNEAVDKDQKYRRRKKYYKLGGKVSFGVRDYYHDWEF